jgi:acetyl esterase
MTSYRTLPLAAAVARQDRLAPAAAPSPRRRAGRAAPAASRPIRDVAVADRVRALDVGAALGGAALGGAPDIDPQVLALLDEAARRGAPAPDPLALPLHEARVASERFHAFLDEGPLPAVGIERLSIPGPGGPLPVRVYRPLDEPAPPALLYFHGGGFVLNGVRTHDRLLRRLALSTGAAVVAPDYAKAPEHRFPRQHEEGFAAMEWLTREGGSLGIDAGAIAVAGDSAGANLALATALACRDRGLPGPVAGLLFYGMYARDFDTPSHRAFGAGRHGLSTARMRWYWDHLLGPGATEPDARAAPLGADLSGLPPMLLVGAGRDCLLDDTLRLADRLRAAGVRHELRVSPRLPHGFAAMTRLVDAADAAVSDAMAWLRSGFYSPDGF